jgi:multiple antibiotic resistance protein
MGWITNAFLDCVLSGRLRRTLPIPYLDELLKATIALLIVVDPAGLVPVVLGLTKGMNKEERRGTFRVAMLVAIVLLVVFAVAGQELLLLFGITVYSFMIAGGILLLILAMQMIFRGGYVGPSTTSDEVGVVPIAFPLLVGPGAITTTIVSLQRYGIVITLLSIVIVMFVAWLVLRYVDKIDSLLGKRGAAVLSTLMAVFIAAIAVQFILTGIQFYYPAG